jgi:transcriptional regulator with XRE-family HTH domain
MRDSIRSFGTLLREWRGRRAISQLTLALDAEISTKHLSYLETGRASPSREMVLRLSRVLEVPLRERNGLLHAAGYAPAFRARSLDDAALAIARRAVDRVLRGHEPYPALAVDRHWSLVATNAAVAPLLAGVGEALLRPPINVLRLSLHPDGLAPRIRNLAAWREHLLERLRRQIAASADAELTALHRELLDYPLPAAPQDAATDPTDDEELGGVAVPLRLSTPRGTLSFISTTTVFGTPVEITLSELAVESFFPADDATAERLRASRDGSTP